MTENIEHVCVVCKLILDIESNHTYVPSKGYYHIDCWLKDMKLGYYRVVTDD